MEHDVHDFIRKAQDDLQNEYVRIQKRAADDPGTAGDQGEENWGTLFKQWLPHYFHVITKGRVLTDSGYASPQIDVLVLLPSYPRILLDKKLYLSGGVAAAFECKTTLTAAHVRDAVATSAALKSALPKRLGSPYKELHAGIIYGLLAHSHSWRGENSQPLANVENALWAADLECVHHPRECIDFISVSDLATWQSTKMTFLSPRHYSGNVELQKIYGPNGSATTGYVCHAIGGDRQEQHFSPIGTLLSGIFSRLAWTFSDMRPLEEYFRKVHLVGSGEGRMRKWPIDIYSEGIRDRVHRGELSNGVPYDEWHIGY
jgi:hypothetical protein